MDHSEMDRGGEDNGSMKHEGMNHEEVRQESGSNGDTQTSAGDETDSKGGRS
jgi:hypothetical protein